MTDNKSVMLAIFSGKNDEFQVWWTKFRAFATAKGVIQALLGRERDLPLSENAEPDENEATEKRKIKARERNSLAMAYLLSAFTQEADISLAYEAMEDPDWPGGLAYIVVQKLLEVYQPKDKLNTVELYDKLLKVKMKKKEDPKILFEQIAKIQNWYNSGSTKKVDKDQLIAVVMKAAPKEYASILNTEQITQGEHLSLTHLRVAMNQYYRSVYGSDNNDTSEKAEMTLAAKNSSGEKGGKKKSLRANAICAENKGIRLKTAGQIPKMQISALSDKVNATSTTSGSPPKESEEIQLANMHWGAYADAFESLLYDSEIFVLDTGATTHSTGNSRGLINVRDANGSKTTVGNGDKVSSKAIAEMPFKTVDGKNGTIGRIHLMEGAPFNLISGTKLLDMGYKMSGSKDEIVFTKGNQSLKFNIRIGIPEGFLLAIRLTRTGHEVGGVTAQTKTISIMEVHRELGHMDKATTRKVAAELGWTIIRGKMKPCESCAKGKAKQKNVHSKNVPNEKHKEVNGRGFLDQTQIVGLMKDKNMQPIRPYWTILVDEKTSFKTTLLTETKEKMCEHVCARMQQWKQEKKSVKTIRMDNGGENKKLVKMLNGSSWKMYPTIEYTARDTPQHNYLAEIGFATIYGRSRALMIESNVPNDKKHIVTQKAIETPTKLDGLIPVSLKLATILTDR